ncbi:hypothetical protein [Flaviflexus massiliensis]|uniref:hypothetical protein n=1 Tax=Flaviflexus massiliensis TaxID=1522309 RepID=UPI00097D4082|nr:hypothetical protein [Flaviflexus massiliensis]
MRRKKKPSKSIKPGNGKALKPYHWWQALYRTTFSIPLTDEHGQSRNYTIDVDYFDWTIPLYTDGVQTHKGDYPVRFPVPGGIIHANLSIYGASRMHYEPEHGDAVLLRPHPKSLEGRRAAFGRKHPVASRLIGWLAIAILLISLGLFIPQLIERISEIEVIADNLGTFTSPINLPAWLNTTLFIAGILAAIERALSLRNHWLIDADTWWLD